MPGTQPFLERILKLSRLSVRSKLMRLIAMFLILMTLMVLYTSLTLYRQKSEGLVINIAGRQRMLTQKFTKEFFLSLALPSGDQDHGPIHAGQRSDGCTHGGGLGIVDMPHYYSYTPSLYEWLVVLGGFGLCGMLFFMGERIFRGHVEEH